MADVYLPDVLLIHAAMTGMDSYNVAQMIIQSWPQVKVIMFSVVPARRQAASNVGVDALILR
jgi:DNA-binding NarL/FixJ family response regulator